jgi:hypothetical protein
MGKKKAIAEQDNEDEIIESTSRTVVSNDIVANYIAQYKKYSHE